MVGDPKFEIELQEALVSAEIIQFIPKPNPDRAKREAELQRQMNEIVNEALHGIPVYGFGIDALYVAPEKDPA